MAKSFEVTLFGVLSGTGEGVSGNVFAFIEMDTETAARLLRLRGLVTLIKENLQPEGMAFVSLTCWYDSLTFHTEITSKQFDDDKAQGEATDGSWFIPGRNIQGQVNDDDDFRPECVRLRVSEFGVSWVGFIKHYDDSPEWSTPEFTWEMLEKLAQGDTAMFRTIHAKPLRKKK